MNDVRNSLIYLVKLAVLEENMPFAAPFSAQGPSFDEIETTGAKGIYIIMENTLYLT
jgi:hypothetical protein